MTGGASQKAAQRRLAVDGGEPVRQAPLPWEWPGVHAMGVEERALVDQVLAACSPFRYYGPDPQGMVERFEQEWCEAFGCGFAVAVSSGTAALSIALSALEIGPGDEVLLPGFLWISCVSAVLRCGAIPRLVDIDESFCLDPDDLEAKLGPNSRAVLYVHMCGASGRIEQVAEIAERHGLSLIEDCAQAVGASVNGRAVGRFGQIAVYSFQLNKNITSGEGGLVATDDPALHRRILALHDLGEARSHVSERSAQLWGHGARMPELAGALALAQLRKLPAVTGAMRRAKWIIRDALGGIPGLGFREVADPAGDSGCFLITTYPDARRCAAMVEALQAEGIRGAAGSYAFQAMREGGLHWYFNIVGLEQRHANDRSGFPWTHAANAFAANLAYSRGSLPRCDRLHDRSAQLSIAPCLSDADIADIIEAFRKVARVILQA